jgi:hypothetical protein
MERFICHRLSRRLCPYLGSFPSRPIHHERTCLLSLPNPEETQRRRRHHLEFPVRPGHVPTNCRIGGSFILHMYLLPLYFQSIRGASPTNSGIRMLPLILALTFTSIGAAGFITAMGMPLYVMLIGAALSCIGSGLIYTFDIDTSAGKWIGYLIIVGAGYGMTVQLGIIVGQASSKPEDIAVTTAAINCMFSLHRLG